MPTATCALPPAEKARQERARVVWPPALEAQDAGADDGRRKVRLNADGALISRRVAGIRMQIAVPGHAFICVAIRLEDAEQRDNFTVRLIHDDAALCVDVIEAASEPDAVAAWKYWSSRFALPRVVMADDGVAVATQTRLGRLLICQQSLRRRGASVAKRRPRIMQRRWMRALGESRVVYADEREIIARN